jgi:hypothetical protein
MSMILYLGGTMSLFIVHKRNPFFRPGTWVELFDEGFQKAVVQQQGNRAEVLRNEGIVIPAESLRPYVIRVQKRGLDK